LRQPRARASGCPTCSQRTATGTTRAATRTWYPPRPDAPRCPSRPLAVVPVAVLGLTPGRGRGQVRLCPGIEVVGGRGDNAAAVTHEVGDGDVVRVGGLSIGPWPRGVSNRAVLPRARLKVCAFARVRTHTRELTVCACACLCACVRVCVCGHVRDASPGVLYTPCHTPGHVTFVAEDPGGGPKCVFTGDTLFVAGCGNFNAGTPQQVYFKRNRTKPQQVNFTSLLLKKSKVQY